MFDKLKKAFFRDGKPVEGHSQLSPSMLSPSQLASGVDGAGGAVSQWAVANGFVVHPGKGGQGLSLQGKVLGKPWLLEIGKPSRNYIRTEELRARAELGLNEDAAVLVINRPLKEALEKKAYSMITDTLQTTADPNLPEEMRWLSLYEEYAWESLPMEFWDRYAVLADRREHALGLLDPQLAELLLEWPQPGPSAEVPLILLVMRGKAYLRMEYSPPSVATLQHAAQIFANTCELAIGSLSTDISL